MRFVVSIQARGIAVLTDRSFGANGRMDDKVVGTLEFEGTQPRLDVRCATSIRQPRARVVIATHLVRID